MSNTPNTKELRSSDSAGVSPKQELREKLIISLCGDEFESDYESLDKGERDIVDNVVQLLSDTVNKVLNEVTREMEQKEKRSGQGSRPEYSRRNETKGEWHSRIQGFKSGCLSAVSAIERVRKEWL